MFHCTVEIASRRRKRVRLSAAPVPPLSTFLSRRSRNSSVASRRRFRSIVRRASENFGAVAGGEGGVQTKQRSVTSVVSGQDGRDGGPLSGLQINLAIDTRNVLPGYTQRGDSRKQSRWNGRAIVRSVTRRSSRGRATFKVVLPVRSMRD